MILRFVFLFISATFICGIQAVTASAAVQNDTPGAIAVIAKDELGAPILGASVQLRVPDKKGKLFVGKNLFLTKIDGKTDGDLKALKSKVKDGDVEILAGEIKSFLSDNGQFEIQVSAPGFVVWRKVVNYKSGSLNTIESENQYVVKIEAADETEKPVTGFTALIGKGMKITDGSANDADGDENGTIYLKKDMLNKSENTELTIAVELTENKPLKTKVFGISNKIQQPILFTIERGETQ